jgi:DNA-binding NarL/FixJ family response regulator
MDDVIRILLVDDHEVVRIGLRTLLDRQDDLVVIGEAKSSADASEQAVRLRPDLILMDLRLPDGSGVEAIKSIKEKLPHTQILVLTAFSEEQLLLDAIVAGAAGHILKEINSDKLVTAIRTVGRGDTLIAPRIMQKALDRLRSIGQRQTPTLFDELSWQERRILSLVAEGKSNREIAVQLGLAEKTVRNYVSQILSKLGVQSRTQAAALAIRHQIDL